MDAQQTDNWRQCADSLFGAHRMKLVPAKLLDECLAKMQHHHAIQALREYRDAKPFRGFYIEKFAARYSEIANAEEDSGSDGAEGAAARVPSEREYWEGVSERAEMDKADERRQFAELPERAIVAARERGAQLGIGTLDRDRGFRLLAIDMYYGRNRENWDGPNAKWQTANKKARSPLKDDDEAHRRTLINTIEALRIKLRDLQIKHGEVVDVT